METVDFFVKEGMQFFTVPKNGKYKVTAAAPGGMFPVFLRERVAYLNYTIIVSQSVDCNDIIVQKGHFRHCACDWLKYMTDQINF